MIWNFYREHIRRLGQVLTLTGCTLAAGVAGAQDTVVAEIESSIIKIYTTSAEPDYFTPWRLLTPRQGSGSGAVIDGNLILTNAHVVANASFVQAQKHNDPNRYQARVAFVSHEADLALITVDDPGFFADLTPLELGNLPESHGEVAVYGYPMGGKTLSVTKGILSRVEQQVYSHSGSHLLAGQIDAAINPGNSGGPVIVDRQIVGVVMQANAGGRAENLGYFVPPSVIKAVLADSADGIHDGFPDLGFRTQTLDSPAAKSAYGLKPGQNGVLVIKVFDESPAYGVLKENDVLLQIDGYEIADDGSIRAKEDLQTDYKYAIDQHLIGDDVSIRVSRHGEVIDTQVMAQRAKPSYSLVPAETYDQYPEYYIYGGVLFVPLNMNLIKRWGSDWSRTAPVRLLQERNEWSTPGRREVVVALQVLASDVNLGYHDWRNWVVDSVNGVSVRDFQHFADLVHGNTRDHVVFENDSGYQMVIEHATALKRESEILARYRIPASWSEDLFADLCGDDDCNRVVDGATEQAGEGSGSF
ncbi:MAG: serine protease [Pseudohongiellaceae bacterium]